MSKKNIEKYITFLAPIKKENKNAKTITYKIKSISSLKFMSSLLSNLADNLTKDSTKINAEIVSLVLNTCQSTMARWDLNVKTATKTM